MYISEVDSTEGIRCAERVEESASAVGLREEYAHVVRDDVAPEVAAEVYLQGVEVYAGCGACVRVLGPHIGLLPEYICLDASGQPTFREGLGNDVASRLTVEVTPEECVDYPVLECV